MISLRTSIISAITLLSLLLASTVPAQTGPDKPEENYTDFSQLYPHHAGPGFKLKEDIHATQIVVLAELSGQAQSSIKTKLKYKPLWAVIDELKVDFEAFQNKMQKEATSILKKAVAENKITQIQADRMPHIDLEHHVERIVLYLHL